MESIFFSHVMKLQKYIEKGFSECKFLMSSSFNSSQLQVVLPNFKKKEFINTTDIELHVLK